jgi:Uma2 family endonuclease
MPISVILKPLLERYRNHHPTPRDVLLIIEVIEVANTTLHTDRRDKLELYARAAIPEYWILNLLKKASEKSLLAVFQKRLFRADASKTRGIKPTNNTFQTVSKPQLEIYKNPDIDESRYREVMTLSKGEPAQFQDFECKIGW